jgi:hypothetical protein
MFDSKAGAYLSGALFGKFVSYEEKSLMTLVPALTNSYNNKLERLSLSIIFTQVENLQARLEPTRCESLTGLRSKVRLPYLALKYYTKVKVNDSDEHPSLFWYKNKVLQ